MVKTTNSLSTKTSTKFKIVLDGQHKHITLQRMSIYHTFSINTQTQYDKIENSEIFTRKLHHFVEPLNSTIQTCILVHDIQYQEVVNLKSIFIMALVCLEVLLFLWILFFQDMALQPLLKVFFSVQVFPQEESFHQNRGTSNLQLYSSFHHP